jgi:hypothetical protein
MALCSGIKADGTKCKAQAMHASAYCIGHDPGQADTRRRRASKGGKRGGRGRPQVELAGIKAQLQELADGVLDGSVERRRASVANQLLNTLLRAIGVELQVKEQLELIERIETLEDALQAQAKPGGGRWGA